jgi:cell wall-associated NlpC family hydrolase
LHHPRSASPNERHRINWNELFRSRSLLAVSCFLIFYCFLPEALAAPRRSGKPDAASCAVVKPNTVQVKSKAKSQLKDQKAKSAAASKKKSAAVSAAPAAPAVSAKTKAKAEAITSDLLSELPENLENEITKFFGLRYHLGGEGQSGFDCSGLIKQVYSEVFGISLPRTSTEQSQMGNLERVSKDDLKTGDLVFFGPNRKRVNHVGMYLAGGHFLHAARSEGVTISRLDESYWASRYMFSKRARGLELFEEPDEETTLGKALIQDSFSFALESEDQAQGLSFLEAGIKINDSLEFLLSGFFLNALGQDGPPPDPETSAVLKTTGSSESEGGFRLAAILSPLEWIKLIPSVTQVEGDRSDQKGDRDYQKFGLETWMILPSSRLAVFMAAHAKSQEDFFEKPLGASPDWQTMDFALGLHYHLSDSLRFSLWGTQSYNPDLKASEDVARRNATIDDVSFQFKINF